MHGMFRQFHLVSIAVVLIRHHNIILNEFARTELSRVIRVSLLQVVPLGQRHRVHYQVSLFKTVNRSKRIVSRHRIHSTMALVARAFPACVQTELSVEIQVTVFYLVQQL